MTLQVRTGGGWKGGPGVFAAPHARWGVIAAGSDWLCPALREADSSVSEPAANRSGWGLAGPARVVLSRARPTTSHPRPTWTEPAGVPSPRSPRSPRSVRLLAALGDALARLRGPRQVHALAVDVPRRHPRSQMSATALGLAAADPVLEQHVPLEMKCHSPVNSSTLMAGPGTDSDAVLVASTLKGGPGNGSGACLE